MLNRNRPDAIRLGRSPHVASAKLGNGLWEHTNYNSRLQPTQIGLGTSGTESSTLRLDYSYGTDDLHNNGNVRSQSVTAPGANNPFIQAYTI